MTKMSISKIVATLIIAGVAIQFIPYGKDHTNPPVTSEPKWDSPQTKALFDRACASCHSNKTKWPKYSNYAPISWLITHDVNEGREKLRLLFLILTRIFKKLHKKDYKNCKYY